MFYFDIIQKAFLKFIPEPFENLGNIVFININNSTLPNGGK